MAPNNTYSTTAVDGSADEYGPSPSCQSRQTPEQLAVDKALAQQRITSFVRDTSIAFVSVSLDSNSTIASRHHAAQAAVTAFDAAFSNNNNGQPGTK
ncbi:hypothetical protein DL95DRAFT_471807 [Leptodontidium sp. 2 PMI_412]|nr:hypothetical protein DL95DRAFT_471807 [Leptodontidium sp. 2 PMI_412]